MNGYKPIFDFCASIASKNFENFRNERCYRFIHNHSNYMLDKEAIRIATIYDQFRLPDYLQNTLYKPQLGYGSSPAPLGNLDELDSRHIMMSAFLFANIPQKLDNIVEIGGGFGNWIRLNYGINSWKMWTIIDLPHVIELQKWYLDKCNIPAEKYTLCPSQDFKTEHVDLVIGAHSLSEFDIETFKKYFENIILKAKYLFYAYHNTLPSKELIAAKLALIREHFDLIAEHPSEEGNVSNAIYERSQAAKNEE